MTDASRPIYSAAVLGCGYIGSRFNEISGTGDLYSHAAAYAAHPAIRLAALCDVDSERAQQAAARWDAPAAFADAAALLAEVGPQIVSICTPESTHAGLLVAALECPSTKAILCEKPLVPRAAEAAHLVELAARRGVALAVNYVRRYDAGHAAARALVAEGRLGRIQTVCGWYTKGIRGNGSHMLDLLRWFFGEPVGATARRRRGGTEDDPCLDVDLEYAAGFAASLRSCAAKAFNLFEMQVVGTAGRLQLLRNGHRIVVESVVDHELYPGYKELGAMKPLSSSMRNTTYNAIDDLVGCCLAGGREPLSTGAEAVRTLRLAERLIALSDNCTSEQTTS